jgi:hypothetical protein
MSGNISEECKKKIRELEDRVIWAIHTISDSPFRNSILPDIVTFLAVSCQYAGQNMDDNCKRLMSEYENEILSLNIKPPSERSGGLETILAKVKQEQ